MTPAAIFRSIALLLLTLGATAAPLAAENGYDLWLRYHTVDDPARLAEYRDTFSGVMVSGASPTAEATRDELLRGLGGLLGMELSVLDAPRSGALVVGTPQKKRPSFGETVMRLENKGLIDRRPDPADARAALIRLNDSGEAALTRVRERRRRHLQSAMADWSQPDVAALATTLQTVAPLLDQATSEVSE